MRKLITSKISVSQISLNKISKHFYNTEGVKKADKCLYGEALELFTKAVDLAPKDSMSYFNRASVKMSIGDIIGAKLDFISSKGCS
jgi:tetratricopeptide (TPR) repeat protein